MRKGEKTSPSVPLRNGEGGQHAPHPFGFPVRCAQGFGSLRAGSEECGLGGRINTSPFPMKEVRRVEAGRFVLAVLGGIFQIEVVFVIRFLFWGKRMP